jgi:two-component system, OmpR family, sensor histidine kinase KdpD
VNERARAPTRGALHVYLGPVPGVGKTYRMLAEGRRLADLGVDVVVGWVETHGRQDIEAIAQFVERVTPRPVVYRNAVFDEMDLDALVERRPDVALVDELAHGNVPGMRHEKRWQDAEELLAGGVGVITTVNIQHLESVKEAAARFTGAVAHETVPDAFVESADRGEVIDVPAEVLRRRVEGGAVFSPQSTGIALGRYFNASSLTGLQDLTYRWSEIRNFAASSASSPFERARDPG